MPGFVKVMLAGLALILAMPALAQIDTSKPTPSITLQWDMASKASGRTYRVWVSKPLLPPPPAGYPIFYVMDGNMTFTTAAAAIHARQFIDLRPAIIVGIGYPTDSLWVATRLRQRDLLPEKPTPDYLPTFLQSASFVGATADDAGGAEQFYHFIVDELRPRLAREMPVNAGDQALWGHSYGGLFTLHVLLNHPAAFQTYIASSPSTLFNNRAILAGVPAFKAAIERGDAHPRILLTAASLENYPPAGVLATMKPEDVLRFARQGSMIGNMMELGLALKAIKGPPGYAVSRYVFDGENHMSVVPASVSRGLTFALGTLPEQ